MQLILTIMCKLHSKHFLPIDGFYVIRKFPCVIACAILRLSFPQLLVSRLRTGLCKSDLRKVDVAQRRMLRTVVGAPSGTDWSAEWHVILHGWNRRVSEQIQACNISTWSDRCLRFYWRFAQYVVSLPADRWVRRALNWVPNWSRRKGRPRYQWDSMLQDFCRWKRCENWQFEAQDEARWSTLLSDFLSFMEHV